MALLVAAGGGLVILLVTLILAGTVRLHASTRADELAVLRLVGATPRFIVRPYAYSAVLTLVLGRKRPAPAAAQAGADR